MHYRTILAETKRDRLLTTRVGDLVIYLGRRIGLNINPLYKYELALLDGFDRKEIERIVYAIRGTEYSPAIFIHGVLPRSGTNYLANLFARHPDIYPHPQRFSEFPLLSITDKVIHLQNDFARVYRRNAEVLKPLEFNACLNSGLLKYLQDLVGLNKTMLFKFPGVHYVDLFRALFPNDYLILLLRDGRDVVESSLKTFQQGIFRKRFSQYCREWHYAAKTILKYRLDGFATNARTLVVRYEDLFSDPETTMREILRKTGMELDKYDFTNLGNMPIRGSSDLEEQPGGVHWEPMEPHGQFNPVKRWKDWSKYRKRKFKAIAGDTLIAAGYEAGSDW